MEWEKGREKQEEKKEGRREWDKERIMNSRGWGGGDRDKQGYSSRIFLYTYLAFLCDSIG